MRYYIVAGEASGDLHGSNLMKGIYSADKNAEIRFWGGNLMNEVYQECPEGGLVQDYKDGAIIGVSQVISNLGKFAKRLKFCENDILSFNPDVVILIDYPGFNFKIAKFTHSKGIKTYYYIAPKVWASRESRVKKIKKYIDKLYIIFPFEKTYFDSKNIKYEYYGNPLVDAIDDKLKNLPSKEEFYSKNNINSKPFIALLMGSRQSEVSKMLPTCIEYAKKLHSIERYKDYNFIIAGAPSRSKDDYLPYIQGIDYIKLIFNQTTEIIKYSKMAIVNSGTASLETALIGTPQIVGYKTSNFNYTLAKLIIKINYISLANLILNKRIFREYLQDYLNAENLVDESIRLMEDKDYITQMKSDYQKVRELLGEGGASKRVAESIVNSL